MRNITRVFLLCCLVSTASAAADPGEWNAVANRRFELKKVDGDRAAYGKKVTLDFGDDGAVSGTVCNAFRGTGGLRRGILTVGNIASTRMLCPDDGLSRLETRLFAMLEQGAALVETAEGIELRRDGTILGFAETAAGQPPAAADLRDDLVGRKFILARVNGEKFAVFGGQRPFIEFADGMRVSGSACNSFSGPGELRDGKLFLRNAAATMMLCIDPKLSEFERDFHRLVQNGAAIRVDGGTLVLEGEGLELEYELE